LPTNYLIAGGSRGLGNAISLELPSQGDNAAIVSRTSPASLTSKDGVQREWLQADLASPDAALLVRKAYKQAHLDVVIYVAGIWEQKDFRETESSSLARIITVNLTSFITVVHSVADLLVASANPKIIAIGSTSGLPNEGSRSVAYTAAKMGMRGACHALREEFRADGAVVTCLSVGSMGERPGAIPLSEVVDLLRWVCTRSHTSCPKEIWLPAIMDTDV
jgi:short-subunit dehydrogenase